MVVVHADAQAERVFVVPCVRAARFSRGGVSSGIRARAPEAGRGWRGGGVIVVVHATSEAERVVGVVVQQRVVSAERFLPQIVEVVWQGERLGWRTAAS